MLQAMPKLITASVFPILNQLIDSTIAADRTEHMCNHTLPVTRQQVVPVDVDLSQSTVVALLNTVVEDVVAPNINALLSNLTQSCWIQQEGAIDVPGQVIAVAFDVPQIGNLSIGIHDLLLENLDTFTTLSAFDTKAHAPNRIQSNVQLGGGAARPLGFSFGVKWDITPPASSSASSSANSVRDEFRLGWELNNLTMSSDLLLKINRFNAMDIPIGKLNSISCLVGLLDELELINLKEGSLFGSLVYGKCKPP